MAEPRSVEENKLRLKENNGVDCGVRAVEAGDDLGFNLLGRARNGSPQPLFGPEQYKPPLPNLFDSFSFFFSFLGMFAPYITILI